MLNDRAFHANLFRATHGDYAGEVLGTNWAALAWSLTKNTAASPDEFQVHPLLDTYRQLILGTAAATAAATIQSGGLLMDSAAALYETATWPPAKGMRVVFAAKNTVGINILTTDAFVRVCDVVDTWKEWLGDSQFEDDSKYTNTFELETGMVMTFCEHRKAVDPVPEVRLAYHP